MTIDEQLDKIFLETWNDLALAESIEECRQILNDGKLKVAALIQDAEANVSKEQLTQNEINY